MQDREPLFQKYDFAANVRQAPERLAAAVDELSDAALMTDNVNELIDRLVRDHMFEVPVLSPDKVETDEGEVQIDVSHDPRRAIFRHDGPVYIKATEYRFYVPYVGQRDAFFCHPSSFDFSPPYADVEQGEIVIRVTKHDERQDAAAIRKEFEQVLAKIETYLQRLRSDMSGLEDRLRQMAKDRIEQRRQKRQKDASLVDQMGFPKRGSRR